ncbi:hypothetical protein J1N35_035599 [Gossypium stocksii]|uniref:Uncharacterized protein n=1 Tax=Gossypium stocksii TaxID=47602 RepID=A0A9D3ZR38_9ROSI|nr:hypothetical protein J1N35_035599 [Gossypium stocksii]
MATPGCQIAEIYVMRKLHTEKMKREEEERAKSEDVGFSGKKSSGCCFPSMFKKVHPGHASTMGHMFATPYIMWWVIKINILVIIFVLALCLTSAVRLGRLIILDHTGIFGLCFIG